MMLWKLLSRIDRSRFAPTVLALSGQADDMLCSFLEIGVPCQLLGMQPGQISPAALLRLSRKLRELAPEIVQGWMYHGNIAATVACAFFKPRPPILWNVRGTLIDRAHDKFLTALVIRASAALSFAAARIINNSMSSAIEHERLGYRASRRVILPNGFDTNLFRPSHEARIALRRSLGLPIDTVLIGHIGRYHSMKDHATFLRAAQTLRRRYPHVHYVLAGEGVNKENADLTSMSAECGLGTQVHLLGARKDIPIVTAALDIMVSSSSSGEGFPNVIGEAMSCGVPCVVTDVGDSAFVVGDTGVIAPPREPEALARGIAQLIEADEAHRRELGARGRQRVIDHFSLESVVHQYEHLYNQVYDEHAAKQRV